MKYFYLFIVMLLASVAHAEVYLTPQQALKQFFADAERVDQVSQQLSAAEIAELKRSLGYELKQTEWTFYLGKKAGQVIGYALLDHEIGKTEPITFMTLISPQGKVEQVEVLVYRESHGSEVRQPRFLKQFMNKDKTSLLRPGQDIVNITGATLSVQAMSLGVKRALVLWQHFFAPGK